MRLTSIESSFYPCEFTAIVPGAYPWEAKICLRLIAETDARSVGDNHPSCWLSYAADKQTNKQTAPDVLNTGTELRGSRLQPIYCTKAEAYRLSMFVNSELLSLWVTKAAELRRKGCSSCCYHLAVLRDPRTRSPSSLRVISESGAWQTSAESPRQSLS